MSRLLLFVLLVYVFSVTEPCFTQQKKGKPDIRVIELDDSSKESGEPEIVALHLPNRRRREINNQAQSSFCKNDDDCGPKAVCLPYLFCVKGARRL